MRGTGSWQAAGPGPGQDWPGQAGQYAHDPRNTGSWQATEAGVPWAYAYDPRSTGSWQAAGPGQGQTWIPGPGPFPQDVRATGSWQAAGASGPLGQEWAGPGQSPGPYLGQPYPGQPYPGQAYPGQAYPGQAYPGQAYPADPYVGQPYPGQPYPGQPYPGQAYQSQHPGQQPGQSHPETGRLGQPQYADGAGMRDTGAFGSVGSPLIRQRDSALPDPPPGPRGAAPIAAIESDSVAAFARDLRVLRGKAGLVYPDMAEKSHYTMRTLASAAGGLRLPTLPVLIAYVLACGGDVGEWEERWGKLSKPGRKGQAVALPPADDRGYPGGAMPPGARQTGEIYVITSARMRDERW